MSCIELLCNKVRELYIIFNTMCRNEKIQFWNPCHLLQEPSSSQYVLLILNRPIALHFEPKFLLNLWRRALLRVTVDGGTNRWWTWLKLNNCENCKDITPDLITGDMDSLSKDVLHIFLEKNKDLRIIKTPDQIETDFTKALREVKQYLVNNSLKVDSIIVVGDTSGRFDQIMANINTLFKSTNILPDVQIILFASNSLTWLLREGVHRISIPLRLRQQQEWCALIPIAGSCKITSNGLKWNLNNNTLEFGKLVSSSNTYNGDSEVTIKTDTPVIWSMGIESLFL